MKPIPRALRSALAKLVRLLASNVDGEVLAAVRAIGRTLEASGCDIHDFAGLVEAPPTAPSTHPEAGFHDQFNGPTAHDRSRSDRIPRKSPRQSSPRAVGFQTWPSAALQYYSAVSCRGKSSLPSFALRPVAARRFRVIRSDLLRS